MSKKSNGSAQKATAKVAAVNGGDKATKKENVTKPAPAKDEKPKRKTPDERLYDLLSGKTAPKVWTLTQISTIRRAVVNRMPLDLANGKKIVLPEEPEKIVERDGRYFAVIKSGEKTIHVAIAAWSPAHTTYWSFRAKKDIEFVALDGCKLEKPTQICEHKFPSFIKELGWLSGGPTPQKRAKPQTKKASKTAKAPAKSKKAKVSTKKAA
jgi:hypothetical protein